MNNRTRIDLTKGNILRKLLKLALPIMLSNLILTSYILVDTFWLGKLGENAQDAVATTGIAFRLINFLRSFGMGLMVAGTALVARYRGAGKPDRIRLAIGQFALVLLIYAIVFIVLSIIFLDPILRALNTPDGIFDFVHGYMNITLYSVFFTLIFMFYQSISHGLGDSITPMYVLITATLLNIVLDPLLIFGIGPFARMEIIGAAYATLIAKGIGAAAAITFMLWRMRDVLPSISNFIPEREMLRNVFVIGLPVAVSRSVSGFGFVILQGFVNSFGAVVIAVNSIGAHFISMYMMPCMGISNALAATVGQNLGANQIKRAEQSVWVALRFIITIMAIGCSLMFFFGDAFTRVFINDAEVVEIGIRMFKLKAFASFLFGFIFVFNGVFNGSGYTVPVFYVSISRLWGIRIPLTYILSGILLGYPFFANSYVSGILASIAKPLVEHPYDALWWSMIISNLIAAIWEYLIYRRGTWKKTKFR